MIHSAGLEIAAAAAAVAPAPKGEQGAGLAALDEEEASAAIHQRMNLMGTTPYDQAWVGRSMLGARAQRISCTMLLDRSRLGIG
jgi:hypothetical protein